MPRGVACAVNGQGGGDTYEVRWATRTHWHTAGIQGKVVDKLYDT